MGGIWKKVLHVLCANAVAMVLFFLWENISGGSQERMPAKEADVVLLGAESPAPGLRPLPLLLHPVVTACFMPGTS